MVLSNGETSELDTEEDALKQKLFESKQKCELFDLELAHLHEEFESTVEELEARAKKAAADEKLSKERLTSLSLALLDLQDEFAILTETCKAESKELKKNKILLSKIPSENDFAHNEEEASSQLEAEIKELETKFSTFQDIAAKIELEKSVLKNSTSHLQNEVNEYNTLQDNCQCEIVACSASLKIALNENELLQFQLTELSSEDPRNVNSRGNGLFAEVADNKKKLKTFIEIIKGKCQQLDASHAKELLKLQVRLAELEEEAHESREFKNDHCIGLVESFKNKADVFAELKERPYRVNVVDSDPNYMWAQRSIERDRATVKNVLEVIHHDVIKIIDTAVEIHGKMITSVELTDELNKLNCDKLSLKNQTILEFKHNKAEGTANRTIKVHFSQEVKANDGSPLH